MGKIHRSPSTLSHNTYTSLFDLLFADVWGLAPIDSSCGYKYLLTCVDAYTRYTWVFPLKLKSNVRLTFTHFITTIEVQFSTHNKAVQTDGGGEFKSLTTLFHSKGIAHRLACPHIHHQNDSVERKHMHVVETGLTWLAQANLPLKFWEHACLTAAYLILLMPTPLLGMRSPYPMLYKTVPDYKYLGTFGCDCFPYLRPYSAHKFINSTFTLKSAFFWGMLLIIGVSSAWPLMAEFISLRMLSSTRLGFLIHIYSPHL